MPGALTGKPQEVLAPRLSGAGPEMDWLAPAPPQRVLARPAPPSHWVTLASFRPALSDTSPPHGVNPRTVGARVLPAHSVKRLRSRQEPEEARGARFTLQLVATVAGLDLPPASIVGDNDVLAMGLASNRAMSR